ncbi:hypothetical protein [Suttonella ornithocola]|uniref:Uncharacterized protein n=1 Tax=Suttonella ornithocola TaxID=279832 RepID=A0A380RAP7_9GAMM|nr:hypothetical protein [Suttonella ornithocola]SUO95191.1 Uncharacterised protein [Suttonella ornithocola]SUQ09757.1 Uncharacterised protein [Suttonella ornithocola]
MNTEKYGKLFLRFITDAMLIKACVDYFGLADTFLKTYLKKRSQSTALKTKEQKDFKTFLKRPEILVCPALIHTISKMA